MAKFKKGDRVRIVAKDKDNSSGSTRKNYDWRKPETFNGAVGYIVEVCQGVRYYRVDETKEANNDYYLGLYGDHEIELLTEYTPITPKVGERYRVLKDMPGYETYGRCKKDAIVTLYTDHNLTTDEHRPLWVTDKVGTSYNLAARDLTTEYLELVEEEKPVFGGKVTSIQVASEWLKTDAVNAMFMGMPGHPEETTSIKKTIIQKTMNAFKKALLSADTKTLIKAGYLYEDSLELTPKGQQALNFIVYEKYQKELVAAAVADIKEEEAKK